MPLESDTRVFLGLDQPPLLSAAEWLIENCRSDESGLRTLDFSRYILVLPSSRNRSRLLQLLIQQSEQQSVLFTPPVLTTLGQLPEYLYVAQKPLATDLAQQIAWSKALEQTPEKEIECLTGRHEADAPQDWQALASLISRLHTRLANDIWSFKSVARAVENETGFLKAEAARWNVLNAIQQRYYSILADVNLWDKQAARNYAAAGLKKAGEIRCSTDRQIVMIGTADLNQSVSEMLRQIVSTNERQVRFLIAAPESMADRFDEFGSLKTDHWLKVPIDITDNQILIVDRPADQADAAACYISNLEGDFSTDQITMGVPDPDAVPQLERSLNAIGVTHRNLAGRILTETGPVRLIIACRDYFESQSFESFASLVRHPDMFRWLCDQVDANGWLHSLDEFQNSNLPGFLSLDSRVPFGDPESISQAFSITDSGSQRRAENSAAAARRLNRIHQSIRDLLAPLVGPARAIADWTHPWSQVLVGVYGDRSLNRDDPADREVLKSCQAILTALGNQDQVPKEFGANVTASQAMDWAIEAASEHRVVAPAIPEAIELAGWLDLPLDDAPVMVITSMNDENVPSSEIGHQFLPNELCKQLRILDNDRRYARDAYALTVIAAVRDQLLLIACRRNEAGEPKKPSRLLFCVDAHTAARRAKAFFGFRSEPQTQFWISSKNENEFPQEQQFPIPSPENAQPLEVLSVTKFRDFMKCPYRFYLKHVLKLESISDDWRELSGGTFGDLTHQVLEAFGKSDLRDSTDAKAILEFLNDELAALVKTQFPGTQLPAVLIQVEQLRLRFERFATEQARWRKSGWRIVSTEELLEHDFDVDGSPFVIRGKIDRVDQHDITGQIAVWDYKSSDKGEPPARVHYAKKKQEWKDLQLPLYRHLVKEVSAVEGGDFSNVLMGYILLPKKLDDVGFHEAKWSTDQLAAADDAARQIIRKIRKSKYWPPREKPPLYSEEFSAICQDNVFEKFAISTSANDATEVAPW